MNEDPECNESSLSPNILQCESHSARNLILPCTGYSESTGDIIRRSIGDSDCASYIIQPSNLASTGIILPSHLESASDIIMCSNSESANNITLSCNSENKANDTTVSRTGNSESANNITLSCNSENKANDTTVSRTGNSESASDTILQCKSESANDIILPCTNANNITGIMPCNSESGTNINVPCYSDSASDVFLLCNSESDSGVIQQCHSENVNDIILACNSKGTSNSSVDNFKNDAKTCNILDSNLKQEDKLTIKCEQVVEGKVLGVLQGENLEIAILSSVNADCTKHTYGVGTTFDEIHVPACSIAYKCETCELSFDIRAQLEIHQENTHGDSASRGKDASMSLVVKDDTIDERLRRGPVRRSFNKFEVEPLDESPVQVKTQDESKRCLRSLVHREFKNSNMKRSLVEQTGRHPDYQSSHFRNLKKFRAAKEFGIKKSASNTNVINKRGAMLGRSGQLRRQEERLIHETADQATSVIDKTSSVVRRNSSFPKMLILCEKCEAKFETVKAFKKHDCVTGIGILKVSSSPKRSSLGDIKRTRDTSVDNREDNVKYSLDNKIKYGHQCDICLTWVDRRSRLARHKLRLHGPKPYVCNVSNECNEAFSEAVKRDRHIRRKHSVEEVASEIKKAKGRRSKQRHEDASYESAVGEIVHEREKNLVGRRCKEENENSLIELNSSELIIELQNRRPVGRPRKERTDITVDESTIEPPRRSVGRPRKEEHHVKQIPPLCLETVQDKYKQKLPFVCNRCGKDFARNIALYLHKRRNKLCLASPPAELLYAVKQEENDISYETIAEETYGKELEILKSEDVEESLGKESIRLMSDTQQECIENNSNDPEPTVEEKSSEDDKMCLRRFRKKPKENEFIAWPKIYDRRYPPSQLSHLGRRRMFRDPKSHEIANTFDNLVRLHECEICGKRFVQNGTMHRHRREIHGISSIIALKDSGHHKLFECKKCGMEFRKSNALFLHCKQSATCQTDAPADLVPVRRNNTRKIHTCNKCGRRFLRPIALFRHQNKSTQCKISTRVVRTVASNDLRTITSEQKFECYRCGRMFLRGHSLFVHQNMKKKCKISTPKDLLLGMNDLPMLAQNENDSKIVQNDSKIAQNDSKLAQNNRKIAQNDSKIAQNDSKIVQNDSNVAQNDSKIAQNENKSGKRKWECNRCEKQFVFGSSLYRHRRLHKKCRIVRKDIPAVVSESNEEKSEKCKSSEQVVQASLINEHHKGKVCKITTPRRSQLVVKVAQKVVKSVFEPVCVIKCDVCAVVFPSIKLFKKHECISQNSTHRNIAPVSSVKLSPGGVDPKLFICPTCNENFTKPEVLKLHTDAGCTLVKRYSCTQCPMTFVQFSSLKAHLLLHTDDSVGGTRKRSHKDYAQLVRSLEESMSANTSLEDTSPEKNVDMYTEAQSSHHKKIKTESYQVSYI